MRREGLNTRRACSFSFLERGCHRQEALYMGSQSPVMASEGVLQKVRPRIANAVGQMLLLIISSLAVYHKMPNREQHLDHDLRYRNVPRSGLHSR